MKHTLIFLLAFAVLTGIGCSNEAMLSNQALDDSNIGADTSTTDGATNQTTPEDPITAAFQRNLQTGATIEYTPEVVVKNLPATVLSQQVGDVMTFGDILFVVILRPSPVVSVDIPEDDIKFAGVLASLDGGTTWKTFFTISLERERDIGDKIYWNVVGMYVQDGKMYIDMADELNHVLRNTVSENGRGAGFTRDDCYTFSAEDYYEPSPNDRQRIRPEKLQLTTGCEWGAIPATLSIN